MDSQLLNVAVQSCGRVTISMSEPNRAKLRHQYFMFEPSHEFQEKEQVTLMPAFLE